MADLKLTKHNRGCLPASRHHRRQPAGLTAQAQFAALTGVAPIPASSGKTSRQRLSRGGDRVANASIHRIVLVRMAKDQSTRDYVAKRTAEGKGKGEIVQCLKRYVNTIQPGSPV